MCSSPPRPRREHNETDDVLAGLETRRPLGAVEAAREVDGARRNPSATPPPPPPPSFYIKVLLHVEKKIARAFIFFSFPLSFFVVCVVFHLGYRYQHKKKRKEKGGKNGGLIIKANQKKGEKDTHC